MKKANEAVNGARIGWRLLKQDPFTEARQAFLQTLDADPENYFSLYGMGWVCVKQNDLDEAISYFDRARSICPDVWMTYGSLAHVYFKKLLA